MAFGDLFAQVKNRASKLYNQFFFDEEAPAPELQREAYPPQTQQAPYSPQQGDPYQQPQVQAAYQPQAQYQQPMQQPYQQPQQQPQQQQAPQTQFSAQYQPPQRNRRAQQHTAQPEDNVVPISAYQQARPQQPMQQAPQQAPQMQPPPQMPLQQPPMQQPQAPQQPPQTVQASGAARIINARGIGDCRSAIMLLRAGDAVVIVMDNITDPAEMRRYVDTLSGACFSLSATITKVSRYGAYFLAPQGMAVYADQVTSQMNGAAVRQVAQRPAYQPQQGYQQQPYQGQPQQAAYQAPVNPYPPQRAPQQGEDFVPRTAENAPQQPFYTREAPNAPQTSFSQQPQAYGYAPDEYREAAQN